MRLSKAMEETITFIDKINTPPTGKSGANARCGRPTHHANLVTHRALMRRGLIQEAADDFHTCTLTAAGQALAMRLRQQADCT